MKTNKAAGGGAEEDKMLLLGVWEGGALCCSIWVENSGWRGVGALANPSWLKTTWKSLGAGEEMPAGAKGHVKNTHILKLLFLFIVLG